MHKSSTQPTKPISNVLKEFVQHESAAGLLLMATALLAMLVANSAWSADYQALLQVPVMVQVAEFGIHKPLLLWINDGLMAIFFLLVGLELKREWLVGELADKSQVVLPAFAALGGLACGVVCRYQRARRIGLEWLGHSRCDRHCFCIGHFVVAGLACAAQSESVFDLARHL
jgi:hypothetical protein